MKQIRLLTIIIISYLIIGNFYIHQANARGIAISSMPIKINDGLKGASYHHIITIHNIDNKDTNVLFNSSGYIKDWITFCDYYDDSTSLNNITINAKNSKQILINITIPEKVANDNYKGTVYIKEKPKENISSTNASIVTFQYPLPVNVKVIGEQNLNITVDSLFIEDNEVEYPTITKIRIINTGNVVARPKIYIKITKNSLPVTELSDTNTKIQPGNFKSYEIPWDTKGMVPGEYNANVTILLEGKTIISKNITFNLLKVGTLKREGYINKITIYGDISWGKTITIFAEFINTGEIELNARFITKISLNDKLIDNIETLEKIVPKSKSHDFSLEYKIPANGSYKLENFVEYIDAYVNSQTETTIITFNVESTYLFSLIITAIPLVIILGAIVSALSVLKRKNVILNGTKNKSNKKADSKKSSLKVKKRKKKKGIFTKTPASHKDIVRFIDNFSFKNKK